MDRLRRHLPPRRRAAEPAGDLRPHQERGAALRPAAVRAVRRRPARQGQALLVRRRRVPRPGRRRARGPARRGDADDPTRSRGGAPHRLPRHDPARLDAQRCRPREPALLDGTADDTGASTLDRAIGSASQRQDSENRYHSVLGTWTPRARPARGEQLSLHYNRFRNAIDPTTPGPQLTFPSLQDGASFRVPQGTTRTACRSSTRSRLRSATTASASAPRCRGSTPPSTSASSARGGSSSSRTSRTSTTTATAHVDDDDLLFAVTLRSGLPNQDLELPNCDNTHFAGFVQDDWRVTRSSRSTSACATSSTPTSRTSAATTTSTRSCSRS